MRPLSIVPSLMLVLACAPRAATSEAARTAGAGPAAETHRPVVADDEPGGAGAPPGRDVSSGLDEAEPAPAAPSAPAVQASKLAACCRALRDMASQAPPSQHDLVLRASEHCERLATQTDLTAAKRELNGRMPGIDPPKACH
jgi:hypothetical protein